jgi:hypothetical protein
MAQNERKTRTRTRVRIGDLPTLEKALTAAERVFQTMPVWRGHSDESWSLQPEVFRKSPKGKSFSELSLIRTFMAHAESRSNRCPPQSDKLGWLLLARHYGLPTRLLDWSSSPLVALYFACDNEEEDGCIWAVERTIVNAVAGVSRRLIAPDEPLMMNLVERAFTPGKLSTVPKEHRFVFSGTREIDPRVLAQQASFSIHDDETDLATAELPTQHEWRMKFIVPKNAKPKLRRRLFDLGITKMTLFPDLGALAEDIKSYSFYS